MTSGERYAREEMLDTERQNVELGRLVERLRNEVARLACGHDEYNRVNRLLTAENERLRAQIRVLLESR